MSMEITKTTQLPINEIMSIGKAFAESGMFPDIKSVAQAVVKIQAGQEMGIAPFAAMSGIHIIAGKPVPGAGIIASKVKASPKYDYKVVEHTDKKCSIDFFEGKEHLGNSTFTIEDAKKAQTKNLDKFSKNMLFARAISNGQKWYCPDVFLCAVYAEEDFDQVTEDTTAEITTHKPTNEQMDRVYDVVNTPSDIEQEEKKEPIPGHWFAKLEKCTTPEEVDELGKKHAETINANPDLRKLFVETKTKLKKYKTNSLPF
jgi:hypothetical protein